MQGLDLQVLPVAMLKSDSKMTQTPFAEVFLEEQEKTFLDQVNVWYVAMTRPEERLYLFAPPPPKNFRSSNALSAILCRFLTECDRFSQEVSEYEFGKQERALPRTKPATPEPGRLGAMVSDDWRSRITIKYRAPDHWDPEDPGNRIQHGALVHSILASVKRAADVEAAIAAALNNGTISNTDIDLIKSMLTSVIGAPALSDMFSERAEIKTEPDILMPDGQFYRPDRVVVLDGVTHIIEFKTGRKNEHHIDQVTRYASALEAMGYERIRKLLVYLGKDIEVLSL
jgi:hypothetical protein